MTRKSLLLRGGAVLFLLLLSVFLFVVGKGHNVYFDTRAVTVDGVEYDAPDTTAVSIDGGEAEEMGRAERAVRSVVGARHTVLAESLAGDDARAERKVRLPLGRTDVIISIPALLAGLPDDKVVLPYVSFAQAAERMEQMTMQEDPGGDFTEQSGAAPEAEPDF